MKTKIFSCLVGIFVYVTVHAQVFDMTSSWTQITTNIFDDSYCVVSNYKLNGDTTINDLQYTKLYVNDNLFAALRENESKIFAYFYSLEAEKLIYDFSWSVGDSICFENYEPINYDPIEYMWCTEVTNIDSVLLLDGKYYKTTLEGNLIQGIGFTKGFLIIFFLSH